MDGRQFDALARALASGVSRRRVIVGCLSGVAGGVLSLAAGRSVVGQDAPPIQPREGSSASEPEEEPASRASALAYFALGDSIASGHGLADENGPDPEVAPGDYLGRTCRDCDSDRCLSCESRGCQACMDLERQPDQPCTGRSCPGDLACGPCCRRSQRAYAFQAKTELELDYERVTVSHLACTGATSLSPLTLDELELDVVSPIPPEQLAVTHYRNGMRLLANQVDAVLRALEEQPASRPTLVSITIGANDMEFARTDGGPLSKVAKRLYWDQPFAFDLWVEARTKAVRSEVGWQARRLLEHDNVVVILTEVPNPFNDRSIFFYGDLVPVGGCRSCYPRLDQAAKALNTHLRQLVIELQLDFPDRIEVAKIHAELEKHKAARPACGESGPEVGTPGTGTTWRTVGTWVQYPEDVRSNSFSVAKYRDWRGDCVHPNEDGAKFIGHAVASAALPLMARLARTAKPAIIAGPDLIEVSEDSAVIVWTTDSPTVGRVEYGQTSDYGRERPRDVGEESTEHHVVLDSLNPGQTYHFRVRSANANGEVVSQDQTFATESLCAPVGDPCSTDSDCCPDGLPYEPTCWDDHCIRICQIDAECAVDDPCVDFFCSPRGRCLYNNREECRVGRSNCPASQIDCGGTCVDPNTDSRYCGGCEGHDCGEKPCRDGVCADSSDGLCQPSDGLDNYRVCGPAGAENACVCLGTSEGQGWCGRVGSYTYRCDERLPACASSADCLPGWACVSAVGCDRACWPACDAASGGGGSIAGDSSLEVHRVLCPSNYQEGDYYGACHHVGQAGVAFVLDGPKGSSATGMTRILVDAGPGVVRFDGLVAGQYILREIEGSLSDGVYVFCSPDQGQTVVVDWSGVPTEPVVVPIPEATAMVCDWYTVPGGWAGS